MARYFINGSMVRVGKDADMDIQDTLPVATYSIGLTPAGYHLDCIENFSLPEKIYGNVDRNCDRILSTFDSRPRGTGVHLDGVKGSGKTLLVKQLSIEGLKRGLPTIVVNSAFAGEEFNDFIQSIKTPCIMIFDEFEKVYDHDKQEAILTLFDGVYPTKKLFVITTNDSGRVSHFLKNRPGRMFYKFEYETLDPDTVIEVLQDTLINKDHIESVVRYTKIFSFINFDMLIAIIEEMNRYGEGLGEVLKFLNIRGESSKYDKFDTFLRCGSFETMLMSKHRYDVNGFTFVVSNEVLWDMYMATKPEEDRVDFEDCDSSVDIGGLHVDMSTYHDTEIGSADLSGFNEDANQFEYITSIGSTPVSLIVRKRSYVQQDTTLVF